MKHLWFFETIQYLIWLPKTSGRAAFPMQIILVIIGVLVGIGMIICSPWWILVVAAAYIVIEKMYQQTDYWSNMSATTILMFITDMYLGIGIGMILSPIV